MENQAPPTAAAPTQVVPPAPETPTTEGKNLTDKERKQLENEYDQLCQDWRWRDKYVLDKLTGSGILFTLLILAIGNIQKPDSILRPFVFLGGVLFSIVSSISIYKDVVFRNGTEKAIVRIAKELGIKDAFQQLRYLQPTINDGIEFHQIDTLRKIQPKIEKSYDVNFLGVKLNCLKSWLYDRATFNWILFVYFSSTLAMFGLFIVSILALIFKWNIFVNIK